MEKLDASIFASVNRNQSATDDTFSTQKFMRQYNITRNSDPRKTAQKLIQESVKEMLSNFIKNGKVNVRNGKYYCNGFEYTLDQIKETIADRFKPEIEAIVDLRFEDIKLELKNQAIIGRIQAIDEEKAKKK